MSRDHHPFALVLLSCAFCFLLLPTSAHAAASLELYGTFHAMGVIVTVGSGDDPDQDGSASVQYRTGGGAYRPGFPLSRVAETRFVGSLFWLQPATTYDIRVTLTDPDGGPLDNFTLDASASTRSDIVIPSPNQTLYVSATGSGTECGLATPCSLPQGISLAQAGDEVVLRGGIYYQGDITLPRSGTSGAPIVIRGYSGETAVLDGADPASFAWTPEGGGVYRTTVNALDPHLVVAEGERLYPHQSLSDLQSLIWTIPGFYASGTDVYVRLAGDANPNSASMIVSRYNQAFLVEQNFIYFLNLTFRHYGQDDYAKAIYFNDASDNLVRQCAFHINDVGIGIKRDSHRNVMEQNEFRDTVFDWPWDAVKAGSGLETGGIIFYGPTTGRGTVIRNNTFHDYFDGLNACPDSTAGNTNETDVYENLFYDIGDDGMETDGQCSNVRIWGNTFHDVLMGISLAPVFTGPVYAIRNLIFRTGVGNNSYSGSPFKFNSGFGTSGPMFLFHNTSDAVLPGNNGLYIKAPGTWQMIYARNNIWAGTDYAVDNYNTSQPVDLDYDDLWTSGSGDLVSWDSARYATLAAFTAATGQETHGQNVEPGFADAPNGNYSLASSSDLIDAGILIPGINDNYSGVAPDIGAHEHTGAGCYVLDGYGGVHPGGAASPMIPATPYFGFDVARALELINGGYYVLDGFGGVHGGGGAPAMSPPSAYFGFDIARDIEMASTGFYVLDGFGGVHAGGGAVPMTPAAPYFGFDISRDLELASSGYYVLDGFGGVHPSGGASPMSPTTPYFGFDVARDLELSGSGCYTLDGFGGVHAGGGASPMSPSTPYFGFDVARDLELSSTGFFVLDGFGGIHAGGGASPMNPAPRYFGFDIAKDLELR